MIRSGRLQRGRTAMTLIEVLCVVALLALVAGIAGGSLVGVTESSRWARAESDVRRVDALARIAARAPDDTGEAGSVRIAIVADGRGLAALRRGRDGVDTELASADFGLDATVVFDPPQTSLHGSPGGALALDARGRSVDVTYVVSRGASSRRYLAFGAVGQIVRDDNGDGGLK